MRGRRAGIVAAVVALALAIGLGSFAYATRSDRPAAAPTPVPTTVAAPSTTSAPTTVPPTTTPAPTTGRPTTRPPAPPDPVAATLARMSLAQRVGQLLMVGVPATGASTATLSALADQHTGGVILTGRSHAGTTATAALTARVRTALTSAGVPPLVSTDQEGGAVQVLQGPGFATMPSARSQGRLTTSQLRTQARGWGGQLRAAGVRLNLAPVADTVPAGADNPPIGHFDREYGADPATVASHAAAFAAGMAGAGVIPTVKHFPGLGRVDANTDTSSGVTDTVTTRTDPYVAPFRTVSRTGHPFVMMSSAIYARIDPTAPAAFSRTVITGMLRGDLGFDGVVISDDLGAARQVADVPPGERAVRFVAAGGDLVLTVAPATAPAMFAALYAKARADGSFRARVDRSAARILLAKRGAGLLPGSGG